MVVDRRAEPVNGYRAVHVIVFPESVPIEIQIRTELQHEWAELFEKLADLVGRDIRYGEPPNYWLPTGQRDGVAAEVLRLNELSYVGRQALIRAALTVADGIADVEAIEQAYPAAAELEGPREVARSGLSALRDLLAEFESLEAKATLRLRREG
jgi:hypothetical protein